MRGHTNFGSALDAANEYFEKTEEILNNDKVPEHSKNLLKGVKRKYDEGRMTEETMKVLLPQLPGVEVETVYWIKNK